MGFPLQLDRSIPFVDAILRIIEGTGTEAEAVQLLSNAEALSEVKLLSKEPAQPREQIPVEKYEELVDNKINRFLSQTHVLGSADYSRLHILIDENYNYAWTHREWGHTLANWANNTRWLGHDGWSYLDFYGGINDRVVQNYNAWCDVAMRIIQIKTNEELP